MMRIKISRQTRFEGKKVYPGDVVEAPDDVALLLKRGGFAVAEVEEVPTINHQATVKQAPVLSGGLALVSLLSGNMATLRRFQDWLRDCDKPDGLSLYLLDSSCSDAFGSRFKRWLGSKAVHPQFRKIVYLREKPLKQSLLAGVKKSDIVGDLYAKIMAEVRESLVLTVEDDVIPPLDALSVLTTQKPADAAAFAAVYPSRHGGYAFSMSDVFERAESVPEGITEVRAVAGGCTLWDRRYVIPLERTRPYKGWDDQLCSHIHSQGGKVYINSDLRCEHLTDKKGCKA